MTGGYDIDVIDQLIPLLYKSLPLSILTVSYWAIILLCNYQDITLVEDLIYNVKQKNMLKKLGQT